MDLNALLVLNAVAKHKSFMQAAKQLAMPSSNVSRKIQILEEGLGVKLLRRSTRNVTITQEGERILALSQGLIESHQAIMEWQLAQNDTPSGTLTITAPDTFSQWPLGQWLIEFKLRYPDINIELISNSQNLNFDEHSLDFAFRFGPLDDSNLIAKPLLKMGFGFYASPKLWDKSSLSLETLKTLPSIGITANQQVLPWSIDKKGKPQSWIPDSQFRVADVNVAKQAAQAGVGVAFLPTPAAKDGVKDKTLKPLISSLWPKPKELYLLYRHKAQSESARYGVFITFIEHKIKDYKALVS